MTAAVPKNDEQSGHQIEALYLENFAALYRSAFNMTRNRQVADDIVQSVFAKLLQGQPSESFGKNPTPYLRRAVINEALSFHRSSERKKLADQDVESLEIPVPPVDDGKEESIICLREAMDKLKPQFVDVLNRHYNDGRSCVQIAKMTGRPLGTVYADLCRARIELKKQIRIQEKQRETHKEKHQRDRGALPAQAF